MKKRYFVILCVAIFTVLFTAISIPKLLQTEISGEQQIEKNTENSSDLKSNSEVPSSSTNKNDEMYHITCAADLALISENIQDYTYAKIVLDCSIDLSGYSTWTPIGTFNNPFRGVFDGKGYSIYNFKINNTNLAYSGLFGYTSGAKIKNFIIDSPIITTVANYVGCVVANDKYSTLSEITLKNVKISSEKNTDNLCIGGIAGFCDSSTIENCRNFVTENNNNSLKISSTSKSDFFTYIGGIIGNCGGTTISLCVNESKIEASNINKIYGGGIAGITRGTSPIEKSYNSGKITLSCTNKPCYAGGISGQNYGKITNCYNLGDIYAESKNTTETTNDSIDFSKYYVDENYDSENGYYNVINNNYNREAYMYRQSVTTNNIKDSSKIGGISGMASSEISNCYNNGKVSSNEVVESTLAITFKMKYNYTKMTKATKDVDEEFDVTYTLKYNSYPETIGNICGVGGNKIKNCYYNNNNTINITKSITSASVWGNSERGSTGTAWQGDFKSTSYRLKAGSVETNFGKYDLGCDFRFKKNNDILQFTVEYNDLSYVEVNNASGDYTSYNGTWEIVLVEMPMSSTTVDANASVGISSNGLNNGQNIWTTENGINNQLPIIKDLYWIYE